MMSLHARLGTVLLATLAGLLGVIAPAAAFDVDTPVGRWQTFDARSAPRGVIHIFEVDGRMFGRIERTPEKRDDTERCMVCTDERHDQPIDGLVIIRNMQRSAVDPLEWAGGDVLDPNSGKLYHFQMRVEDQGTKLVVRGFFGVSLLGKTQTWKRI